MAIKKIVAGEEFSETNSTGGELASSINTIIDVVESPETGNAKLAEKIGETKTKLDTLSEGVSRDYTAVKQRFSESINSGLEYTYIVTGDSTRSNSYNGMIPYYNEQLSKIGWNVVDNAESGLKTLEWNASSRAASLNAAIAATTGLGETTILEYSLGINDSGTYEERKAAFIDGINTYLSAKPKALIVLVSPVGGVAPRAGLTDVYRQISNELNLDMIDGSMLLDDVFQDPKYMTDATHPNVFGSKRVVNGILSEIIPPSLKNAVTLTDNGLPPLPDINLSPIVQGGYWSVSAGSYLANSSQLEDYRCLEKIAVEPNFTLRINHGGNMFHCVFYDIDGNYLSWATSSEVSGNEREITIPTAAYFVAINISDDPSLWDSLNYNLVVEYKLPSLEFMNQPTINKNLPITLPYVPDVTLDSSGRKGRKGQVLTAAELGKTQWIDKAIDKASGVINSAEKIFSRNALGEIALNYIVSGDSNRSNNFNNMIDYYNNLLGQVGVAVVDNARSGQSGLNWKNGTSSPTVQEAIDATPGTGATTLLEYSFGPNDRGTNSEIKAALKGGIELYLAAKPDATVVLCSPVRTYGKYGALISIYEEIAQELDLQLIKPHTVIEPHDNDPRFKQDTAHLNNYGSQRLLHFILSNMVDEVTRSSITITDLGIISPPDANIAVVTKIGYWNYSDGVHKPTPDTWRCTEIIPVEPNYTLHVDHGGTSDKAYWYDIDGEFMRASSMSPVGGNAYNIVVPNGAYGMALNITDDGATYDALSYAIDVHYVVEEQSYMSPEDTNVNMALGFPRHNEKLLDSNGKMGSKGQVLTAMGLGKTEWTTPAGLDKTKNVVAIVSGDNLYLGYKISETEDIFWHFATRGVNSAYSANKAYKFDNMSEYPRSDYDFTNAPIYLGNIDTDWVGPYIAKKQSQSTTNNFVGGHHDSTGGTDPLGVPTARSTGRTLKIDGKSITEDGVYRCEKVEVSTSNFIKSSTNTDDSEIIRQDVDYTFNSNGLVVKITTVALEDIRVDRFYGVQCYAKEGFDEVRFLGDQTASGSITQDSSGAPADVNTEVRAVNHHLLDGNVFTSFVLDSDLGNFRFKGVSNAYCSRSNFKTYFNLIYAFNNMPAGSKYEVVGGYAVTSLADKTGGSPQAKSTVLLPTPYGARIYADFYGVHGKRNQRLSLPNRKKLICIKSNTPDGAHLDSYIESSVYSSSDGSVTPNALVYGDYMVAPE